MWQRIGLELDFCAIASNLNISLATVQRICTLFEQTGKVDPKVREHSGFVVDTEITQAILSIVFEILISI